MAAQVTVKLESKARKIIINLNYVTVIPGKDDVGEDGK